MARNLIVDDFWADEDGRPLGGWQVVTLEQYRAAVAAAGGIESMTVFATCTDPDGVYGAPRVYTAWGLPDSPAPAVDVCDYYEYGGSRAIDRTVFRIFVTRTERHAPD